MHGNAHGRWGQLPKRLKISGLPFSPRFHHGLLNVGHRHLRRTMHVRLFRSGVAPGTSRLRPRGFAAAPTWRRRCARRWLMRGVRTELCPVSTIHSYCGTYRHGTGSRWPIPFTISSWTPEDYLSRLRTDWRSPEVSFGMLTDRCRVLDDETGDAL